MSSALSLSTPFPCRYLSSSKCRCRSSFFLCRTLHLGVTFSVNSECCWISRYGCPSSSLLFVFRSAACLRLFLCSGHQLLVQHAFVLIHTPGLPVVMCVCSGAIECPICVCLMFACCVCSCAAEGDDRPVCAYDGQCYRQNPGRSEIKKTRVRGSARATDPSTTKTGTSRAQTFKKSLPQPVTHSRSPLLVAYGNGVVVYSKQTEINSVKVL